MRQTAAVLLLISFILSGCAGTTVKTYTFQKDRVDQTNEGNRGYLQGSPPPAPAVREAPKRTLIGIDVEIPVLPIEDVEIPPTEVEEKDKKTIAEIEVAPRQKGEPAIQRTPAPKIVLPPVMPSLEPAGDEEEEEWVK
jgi:hypothetical protein